MSDEVQIGGRYIFTALDGGGPNGKDSTVGQYDEQIVTVLRELIEGVDEECRPMFRVKGESTPEFDVFDEEIRFNPVK